MASRRGGAVQFIMGFCSAELFIGNWFWRSIMNKRVVALALWLVPVSLCAQWLNFPTPGIPRTADGKLKLNAPAPHTAEGKPDFSGLWQPGPSPYFLDVIQDPKDESIFLPAAEALFKKHLSDF